jgi:hypothetical protein
LFVTDSTKFKIFITKLVTLSIIFLWSHKQNWFWLMNILTTSKMNKACSVMFLIYNKLSIANWTFVFGQ